MTRLNATDARSDFSTTLSKVAFTKERVLLERHGKPLAALVPVEDLELLQELENRLDLAAPEGAEGARADPVGEGEEGPGALSLWPSPSS